MRFAIVLAVAGLCAFALRVDASPSSLNIIPSTDFYGPRVVHLNVTASRVGAPTREESASAGLSLGLGKSGQKRRVRAFEQAEIGFDTGVLRPRDGGVRTPFGDTLVFNAKALLFDGGEKGVRVATGAFNLGNKSSGRTAYVVGSRDFGLAGRLHLGVWRTLNKDAFEGRNYTQILLGYEKPINDRLWLVLDHASGSGPAGATGLSVIYTLNAVSSLQLAYLRPNSREVRASDGRNVFFISYDLDFGPGAKELSTSAADPTAAPGGE